MSEQRNDYGIPCPGDLNQLDPLPRIQRHAPARPARDYAFDDPDEPDTWRDEMTELERHSFDLLQARVERCTASLVHPDTRAWIVEETLYQLWMLIARKGHILTLPGLGMLYKAGDGHLHTDGARVRQSWATDQEMQP
jgi:hypothetical protein